VSFVNEARARRIRQRPAARAADLPSLATIAQA
jgi:hypothetical protein